MRRLFAVGVTAVLVLALAAVVGASTAGAGAAAPPSDKGPKTGPHDLPSPLSDKQRALRAVALEMQVEGKIPRGAKVGKVAKGQYVQLAREGEDSIWTVIGDFGTQVNPTYGGDAGPVHNEIPEPDRSVDNTTIWSPDFSRQLLTSAPFTRVPWRLPASSSTQPCGVFRIRAWWREMRLSNRTRSLSLCRPIVNSGLVISTSRMPPEPSVTISRGKFSRIGTPPLRAIGCPLYQPENRGCGNSYPPH